MSPRLSAIFFDVGDTLLQPWPSTTAVAEAVLRRLEPTLLPIDGEALSHYVDVAILAHRRQGRLVHYPAAAAQQFWISTYRDYFVGRLPTARADRLARALLAAYTDHAAWQPYPDVTSLLASVRPTIPIMGILSNWEDWLSDLLQTLNLASTFDHILVSGELGLEKPDPAIFQRALTLAGVPPTELVYVGDSLHHDIEPCLALGIRPILIDRHNRHPDDPRYARLTSLHQLPARLGLPG